MREFVYFSTRAWTTGNFTDLMKAGRMDIVCNVVIAAFFLSHRRREDTVLHLVFHGPPNSPTHIELRADKVDISKKDVAGLIKRLLYKCKDGKKIEVIPGASVERKSFQQLLKDFEKEGKKILLLDKKGKFYRELEDEELKDAVFVIGDHDGLPKKEMKRYKDRISLGKEIYFASQTFVILHHELDLRG